MRTLQLTHQDIALIEQCISAQIQGRWKRLEADAHLIAPNERQVTLDTINVLDNLLSNIKEGGKDV